MKQITGLDMKVEIKGEMFDVGSIVLREGQIVRLTTIPTTPFGPFYDLPPEDIAQVKIFVVRTFQKDCFFDEGLGAYHDGVDLKDCPYDEGTDGQAGWISGWKAGNEL